MTTDGRPTMLERWRALSRSDRLELYLQSTLYVNVLLVPLVALGAIVPGARPDARSVATAATVAVHVAVCVLLMRSGIAAYLGRRSRPGRLVAAGAISTVVATATAIVAYPSAPPDRTDGPAMAVLVLVTVLYAIALATTAASRTVLLTVGAAGCAAIFLLAVRQGLDPPRTPALVLSAILLVLVPAARATVWTIGMVRELERMRWAEASLAVADERLRFARDLHDVLGRSLSVVAVKAELAARLSERGRAEATDEMLEVRRIAQESLTELREVVGGYRSADLGTELAGARALLTAAGIACRVEASTGLASVGSALAGLVLPEAVQGPLGWVVREATTNVLRHCEAKECVITVGVEADVVTLTMDNDGVPPGTGAGPVRLGHGLTGLTERIGAVGGTVTASRRPETCFRLVASVPLTAAAARP